MCDPDRFVWLSSGLVAPAEALALAWRLEDSGFRFRLDAEGRLEVAPFADLTREDLAALRRWRLHLAAIISHDPPTDRPPSVKRPGRHPRSEGAGAPRGQS